MKTITRVAAAALVVSAVIPLAACGGDASAPDVLRYGLSSAPTCADPAQSSTNQTVNVVRQVVDSLLDQDRKTGELKGWLARKFQVSPDGRSFTFTLRDDVTFSDGTPLTADVVKKNFDALTSDKKTSTRTLQASAFLLGYQRTETPDKHTAIVRFAEPNVQFLQATATTQLGILAPATVARTFDERCTAANVVGSGPYTYTGWEQNRSASLTRRDNYAWAPDVGFAPKARYRTVEFSVVPESGVRAGSVGSGQLDAVADAQPQDRDGLAAAGASIVARSNPGLPFVFQSNVSRGVLADRTIRTAVTWALDRPELVSTVLGDSFKPATSVLASTTPGYRADPLVKHDPDAAKKVLDAAGWRGPDGGTRSKNGTKLSFDVIYSPEFYGNKPILELIQRQLAKVGIDLTITALANDDFLSRRSAGDFDAVYYNVTRADPDILRSRVGVEGPNYSHRAFDANVDPLLTQQAGIGDRAQRLRVVDTVQTRIADAGYVIPVVELSQVAAIASGFGGIGFDASGVLRLQYPDEQS
ncbi:putative ABC transporter substrate binding protein [Gordonia effusa NBRC 100432]|uniref:Putative ABC transporter substrate binding protein n=1 Tax=Gordonia effusa NBRC 100432 TaxID=1077974 RepID=H0QZ94_9ACTN|nr:ABC transporter substrate-binding protein [Gordonia effusa]GAB18145.1 putative ABC transporter substrate binding protein [Gordonia effusa NBRC 100432]